MSHVSFLDTTTYRTSQHTLAVRPFLKNTDMNTYLHFFFISSKTLTDQYTLWAISQAQEECD